MLLAFPLAGTGAAAAHTPTTTSGAAPAFMCGGPMPAR
jgi:hypothetical protein